MKKSVHFRHVDQSEALEEHCSERIEWLTRHTLEPDNVAVFLSFEGFEPKVEVSVKCQHTTYFAEATTSSFPSAIDQAFQKVSRQLSRKKETVKNHKWKQKVLESRPAYQPTPSLRGFKKAA